MGLDKVSPEVPSNPSDSVIEYCDFFNRFCHQLPIPIQQRACIFHDLSFTVEALLQLQLGFGFPNPFSAYSGTFSIFLLAHRPVLLSLHVSDSLGVPNSSTQTSYLLSLISFSSPNLKHLTIKQV